MMTVEELRKRVEYLIENCGDDEGAHSNEDELRADVLQAIADGHPDAQELARLALRTSEADFSRWYA